MRSRRSSPRSRADGRVGYSLVELLVTAAVTGIAVTSAVTFLASHMKHLRGHTFRLEAQQAMRTSLDAITRDLRLAGACLPTEGQYIAIAGANGPGPDSITIRTGMVRNNLSCIVTATSVDVPSGASSVQVANAGGFTSEMLVYVRHPNGAGEIHRVTGVNGVTIDFAGGLQQDYPAGSGMYAIDERSYALDLSDANLPKLMLTVNRDAPETFAAGMTDLQVRYVLNENCPPCDQVDLPATTAQWQLVNEVTLSATLRSIGGVQPQDIVTLTSTSWAKPRNLLP